MKKFRDFALTAIGASIFFLTIGAWLWGAYQFIFWERIIAPAPFYRAALVFGVVVAVIDFFQNIGEGDEPE